MDFTKLIEMDRAAVLHPFTNLKDFNQGKMDPTFITGGKGIYLENHKGEKILDAFAGLYCMNLGYGREDVAEAIAQQAKKIAYYHTYVAHTTDVLAELSHKIVSLAPGMSKVFYGLSGSDANETQAKFVWFYHNILGKPQKKKIIARDRGYHGCSVVSGSMTGLSFYHEWMDIPVSIIKRTGSPHYFLDAKEGETELEFSKRRARELEELILAEGPDTIGAFIGEPALGTGGIVPPPEGYWEEIQKVLSKYDVLLIADEVVTGFGRTGAMTGSEKYGMKPDLMTFAKGLTSAYVPLSATAVSQKVFDVFCQASNKLGAFSHGYTYSGHPLAAATALKVLSIVEAEKIPQNAAEVGTYLLAGLRARLEASPIVGDVRGVGLMNAVEFRVNKERTTMFDADLKVGAQVSAACLAEKMIARGMPHGDILGISPPLILTKDEADIIVERVGIAVDNVTDNLVKQGVKLG